MKQKVKIFCAGFSFVMLFMLAFNGFAQITCTWHKPVSIANGYNNIFVAAITSNVPVKRQVEDELQKNLQQKGLIVEKSVDVFPAIFSVGEGQKRDFAISQIIASGANGILTISLLRKQSDSHYEGNGHWQPGLAYAYYNRFSDYYNNRYPAIYAPGYEDRKKDYFIETNFYNAQTEQLVWAAQSKTYRPENIKNFLMAYIPAIFKQLMTDGVITAVNLQEKK